MIELQSKTGLPISLNDDGNLLFAEPLKPAVAQKRTLAEMKEFLADPQADFAGDSLYDMYRNVCLPQDAPGFEKAQLRFDLTVFHPGLVGQEFCKTAGHYHPKKPGTNVRYPETYEVVLGKGLFLMQKMDDPFSHVLDVYAMEVKEGEDVIFLPGYAHFLINTAEEVLITSNWSAANFQSEYRPVAKYHGAAYYVIKGADGQPEFIHNKNYSNVPALKKLRPKELPPFGLISGQPAYRTGQESPDMLQFLIDPELYLDKLTIENCYHLS